MNDSPLVSVCIPSYRGAAFLGETIESVLSQTHRHLELLICDDASPDETRQVVERFDDPRLKFLPSERNLGPEGNWNRCLALASGKYYQLLPQDDLLAPGVLQQHVDILESDADEDLAIVFGSRQVVDPQGKPVVRRGLPRRMSGRIRGPALVRRCVQAGTNMIGEPGNGLMRLSLARRLGRYDSRSPYMIDLDFWFRALAHGDGYYTGTQSSSFRISPGSWSVALGKKQLEDFTGFVERFAVQPHYGITPGDMRLGFAKARFNTVARALIYRFWFGPA